MTFEELLNASVHNSLFLYIQNIVIGPILWTVGFIGMALNIVIVLPKLISSPTSSSILEAAISFALLMKALSKLPLHDFIQGDSNVVPSLEPHN